ncbi:uncharacterized protein A4U43_C08F19000 [Asparagus officinalis]|uniref:uncharacterized protein LOC109822380 n=1 Tax=Asparagus officinalis TaxID=4686 RepID=UPI00098E312B|nr:uncharacterized protein LOC109822380 [Asparagus officinalis]ONK60487.1 uncharacterized protein A4U43_C08F19000 [Asparagus officinalis]
MGDVLAELEEVLRSKRTQDKITPKEEFLLQTCKARAIGDFTVGALASSAVVWIATRRLTYGQRFNTSVGSAIVAGMWRFNGSLNSCVNQILELEGSRMQRELAQIILTKHYNNASRMKLVKKHFYSEEVFSDSNPDKPYVRWRFRNIYYDDSGAHKSEDDEPSSFHEKPDSPQMKQFMRQSTADTFVDPLDFIFGHREEANTNMETSRADDSTVSRKRLRAHKRAHRHHRAQQAV